MTKTIEARAWRGQIRMPAPLADWLKARADDRYRSINAEIVDVVLRAKEAAQVASTSSMQSALLDTEDIERRAVLAYRKATAMRGETRQEPGLCDVHEVSGIVYARLSNVTGVLAIYRVHRDGNLQRVSEWPAALN